VRVEINGQDQFPPGGVYLVNPNHISIFKPALIAAFGPRDLENGVAVEVLDRPFRAELMRLYGTILVNRDS
jgi:1-acyl-sn-glycerol-3-phosphate acyltransferase